ncbi:MAG TPA: DNA polymerase I [Clostridia bacterium]|nr:DNA polymerase I [Clostridia bacterium]
MEQKRVIIVDGNSIINRAFYAIPSLVNKDGIHTNAIYGFYNMLFKLLDDYKPDYLSIAFDVKAKTFRHKQFEDYKGHRAGMPDELAEQMPIIKEILDALGIERMELAGYEADDLIGTVSQLCADADLEVLIISGDKDILQLVNDNVTVLYTKRGISNLKEYREIDVVEEFGVKPVRVPDYKGLRGDSSDNIPGVAGIGDKTAKKLLKQFDSVEEIIMNQESIKSTRARNSIEGNEEVAVLSKKLATIMKNVPIEFNIEELIIEEPEIESVITLLKKYDLNSIISRLKNYSSVEIETSDVKNEEISSKALAETLKSVDIFSFKIIYDNINIKTNEAISIAVSYGEKSFYVDFRENDNNLIDLKEIFENEEIIKYGYEMKLDYLILLRYDIDLKGIGFDSFIAKYLIEPSTKHYYLSNSVMEHFSISIINEDELLGKGAKRKEFSEIDKSELKKYSLDYSYYALKLKDKLSKRLEEAGELDLFTEIEMPLIGTLARIEFKGFNIDQEYLKELDIVLTEKLANLTEEIYELSGEKFNINSPKQLGVILFEKLELPVIKKTKTGYSTAHSVLEKLENKHEIIPLIMEYRTYQKLKSTYIDGLFDVINQKSKRIHTSLNQTVTVTGRLSSSNPNLQNIPVRLPFGRKVRKVFIPSEGNILLGADYSQIELRILAHMSKDEKLLHAYKNKIDIHRLTASQVFNVELEDVTNAQRSAAKSVNFGIVYGMSDHGLSQELNISRKEAQSYIDKYFANYSGVKTFMDEIVEECKDNHYVTTLLSRKRYIRDINSKNYFKRQFAERTAQNTPIQGSAADIIKIAMIDTEKALLDAGLNSKLVLQVHDELLLDVIPDELQKVKEILKESMEKAYTLDVPLVVDMKEGKSWYETK